MDTVTVQTKNVDVKIRDKAEKIAREAGFSSLQDVIRIMIIDIANEQLPINMNWGAANDPEVRQAIEEYKQGKYSVLKKGQKITDTIKS